MVFFPSLCEKHEGIFLWYLLWEPGLVPRDKSHKIVGGLLGLIPPGVFNSQTCLHWPSYNHQLLQHWFPIAVSAYESVFALVNCHSLYLSVSLSDIGDSNLPCDFISLMDPRWVVNFPVCWAFYFYLLLEWSAGFPAPHMQNGKLEMQLIILTS